MKSLSILLLAISAFAVSCERHEFEGPDGTKQLHQHHDSGHGDHGHGDAHGEEASHEGHDAHEGHDHKKDAH